MDQLLQLLDALGDVADSDPVVLSALSICAALTTTAALLIVAFFPIAPRREDRR